MPTFITNEQFRIYCNKILATKTDITGCINDINDITEKFNSIRYLLSEYAKHTELSVFARKVDLEDYVTTYDIESIIRSNMDSYVKSYELNDYAKITDLNTVSNNLTNSISSNTFRITNIENRMGNFVDLETLQQYIQKFITAGDLISYVSKSELNDLYSNLVTKDELEDYAKYTDISTDYLRINDLEKYLPNFSLFSKKSDLKDIKTNIENITYNIENISDEIALFNKTIDNNFYKKSEVDNKISSEVEKITRTMLSDYVKKTDMLGHNSSSDFATRDELQKLSDSMNLIFATRDDIIANTNDFVKNDDYEDKMDSIHELIEKNNTSIEGYKDNVSTIKDNVRNITNQVVQLNNSLVVTSKSTSDLETKLTNLSDKTKNDISSVNKKNDSISAELKSLKDNVITKTDYESTLKPYLKRSDLKTIYLDNNFKDSVEYVVQKIFPDSVIDAFLDDYYSLNLLVDGIYKKIDDKVFEKYELSLNKSITDIKEYKNIIDKRINFLNGKFKELNEKLESLNKELESINNMVNLKVNKLFDEKIKEYEDRKHLTDLDSEHLTRGEAKNTYLAIEDYKSLKNFIAQFNTLSHNGMNESDFYDKLNSGELSDGLYWINNKLYFVQDNKIIF